ncbi:MAG: LysR substrate-binding domain-containing protein [Pseudomonadota bacterium]
MDKPLKEPARRDLTMHQMRCFCAMVEAGSISRAAARVGISQSAMSRTLAQIETVLGARLFERSHHGLYVTAPGSLLYETSLKILDRHEAMRGEIDALRGRTRGHCRVAMPESVGRVLFLPLVQRMGTEHPDCTLRVMAAFSASMPELLLSGQLDVAIVTDTHTHSGLDTEPLATEDFVLIGPRDDVRLNLNGEAFPARRLTTLPLILTAWSGGIRVPIDATTAKIGIDLDIRLEIDSNQAILDLVQAGEGYSILPFSAVHREVRAGSLAAARIVEPAISRTLYLATPANRPVSPASREVLKLITALVSAFETSGGWRGRQANS